MPLLTFLRPSILLAALVCAGPRSAAAVSLSASSSTVAPGRSIQIHATTVESGIPQWDWKVLASAPGVTILPAAQAPDMSTVCLSVTPDFPSPATLIVKVEDARQPGHFGAVFVEVVPCAPGLQAAAAQVTAWANRPALAGRASESGKAQCRSEVVRCLRADEVARAEGWLQILGMDDVDPSFRVAKELVNCALRQLTAKNDPVAFERLMALALGRMEAALAAGLDGYDVMHRLLKNLVIHYEETGQEEAAERVEERWNNLHRPWPALGGQPTASRAADLAPSTPPRAEVRGRVGRLPRTFFSPHPYCPLPPPCAPSPVPPRIANRDRGLTVLLDAPRAPREPSPVPTRPDAQVALVRIQEPRASVSNSASMPPPSRKRPLRPESAYPFKTSASATAVLAPDKQQPAKRRALEGPATLPVPKPVPTWLAATLQQAGQSSVFQILGEGFSRFYQGGITVQVNGAAIGPVALLNDNLLEVRSAPPVPGDTITVAFDAEHEACLPIQAGTALTYLDPEGLLNDRWCPLPDLEWRRLIGQAFSGDAWRTL